MLRFPVRPDALPLNLIWNFETTSNQNKLLKDIQSLLNYSNSVFSVVKKGRQIVDGKDG